MVVSSPLQVAVGGAWRRRLAARPQACLLCLLAGACRCPGPPAKPHRSCTWQQLLHAGSAHPARAASAVHLLRVAGTAATRSRLLRPLAHPVHPASSPCLSAPCSYSYYYGSYYYGYTTIYNRCYMQTEDSER